MRADFSKRFEDKWSLCNTRVGKLKLPRYKDFSAIIKDVQIKSACSMEFVIARTASFLFESLKMVKQI